MTHTSSPAAPVSAPIFRVLVPLIVIVGISMIGVATAQSASAETAPVRLAWPAKQAHRPPTGLTRWLARQVGPATPVPCAKRSSRAQAHCNHGKRAHGKRAGGRSARLAMRVPLPAAGPRAARTETIALRPTPASGPLQLIRSFEIPPDDPSYERLLNWSYTYDSALAATAFATEGLSEQSGRLLDQLAALQRKDGSIELAFNVETGEGSGIVSAGSLAFSAIAFTDFDSSFGKPVYLENARRAVDYLLSLRNELGLVRGGPEVKWASTQHNLLSLIAVSRLAAELERVGEKKAARFYDEAAVGIAKGIESQLIVRGEGLSHFREGLKDEVVPLDVQALGVIYALYRGDTTLAKEVFEYAQQNFAISERSIELSKDPATYNMTYQAKGPFTGYRPYLGKGAPDVLWFEGTAEMRLVSSLIGAPTEALDASTNAWWNVTRERGVAPLGADRTVTGNRYNEYHVWPTAAAGAWTVLSRAGSGIDWATPKGPTPSPIAVK